MGGGHPVLHRPSRGFVWATRHSDKIWTKSTNYTKFPGNESKPLLINELFTKYVCTSQNRVEVMSIELWRSVSEEDTRVRKSSEKVSRSTVWEKSEATFCRSALLLSFCENRFCLSQLLKKLNSTKRGALFRHFCVSKVITTAHAHKSGVIFHFFSKSFQTKKKLRLYDQRWLK